VWDRTGHPVRAGQGPWRPYEELSDQRQLQSLEAAATAIHLFETRAMTCPGREAEVFLPQPDISRDPGSTEQTTDPTAIRWQEIKKNFQAVVEEARTTPETARQLFNFCTMYRRDNDEVIQGVRSNFTELGIPSDYLSP